MRAPFTATAVLVGVLAASAAGAFDITACGQIVADGDTGVLQANLDCSAAPGDAAITLGRDSTLDMNGHAIVARRIGVDCGYNFGSPRCTVRGHGVAPSGVGDLSGGDYGITGAPRRVIVSDVVVHDVAIHGISVNQKLEVTNVTAQRAGSSGVVAIKRLTATGLVASDNGDFGIDSARIRGTNIIANGNGYSGVSCRHCLVTGLVANDNGFNNVPVGAGGGVQATRATLFNSTVTGNVVDGVPVDIDTFGHPHLVSTTCDHSRERKDTTRSWGVCQLD
jgi:hypothetical protein